MTASGFAFGTVFVNLHTSFFTSPCDICDMDIHGPTVELWPWPAAVQTELSWCHWRVQESRVSMCDAVCTWLDVRPAARFMRFLSHASPF